MMLEVISGTMVAISLVGAIVSWFTCVINLFRMVANRKEGVPLFQTWYDSPWNIIFRPHLLTERGLAARRRCMLGFAGFVLFIFLGMAAGAWIE